MAGGCRKFQRQANSGFCPDTPFFLVEVEPAADLLGHNSPHHLLAVLAILPLPILGSVAISGFGLASAFSIIKNHHGHIAAESKLRVGTTFTIYLPAVERQITSQLQGDRGLLARKGKILVMDDEEMVRDVLGKMFPLLGYEAEFAGDGSEAIEKLCRGKDATGEENLADFWLRTSS